MEIQQIEVIIGKDGQVRIEVQGVKGASCLEITKALEGALGDRVSSRQMTAEASEPCAQQADERLGRRCGRAGVFEWVWMSAYASHEAASSRERN